MRYIGIDPGKSGAIAWEDGDGIVQAHNVPESLAELATLLFSSQSKPGDTRAYIEKIHSMPTDARTAAFTFGKWFGYIEMALVCHGISYKEVAPTIWQRAVCGILPKEKADRKKEIQRQMQALYPHWKVTLRNADALAIFTYAKEHAAK